MSFFKTDFAIPAIVAIPTNIETTSSAFQLNNRLVYNDNDINIELNWDAMIKAIGKFVKSITVVNNYVETFLFQEDCFLVQVKIIKNCKIKIAIRSTVYTKLVTKFFEDRL